MSVNLQSVSILWFSGNNEFLVGNVYELGYTLINEDVYIGDTKYTTLSGEDGKDAEKMTYQHLQVTLKGKVKRHESHFPRIICILHRSTGTKYNETSFCIAYTAH